MTSVGAFQHGKCKFTEHLAPTINVTESASIGHGERSRGSLELESTINTKSRYVKTRGIKTKLMIIKPFIRATIRPHKLCNCNDLNDCDRFCKYYKQMIEEDFNNFISRYTIIQ